MSQIDHGVKQETTTVPFPFYLILAKTYINCELHDYLQFESICKFCTYILFTQKKKQRNIHKI